MNLHDPPSVPVCRRRTRRAFTLVELLVVASVIVVLLGLLAPVMTSIKGGRDITGAAYDLAGELETARSFAISNHTYAWVGFYEQDYNNSSAPTAPSQPPYSGIGHVIIGTVYSKDGTRLVDDATAGSVTLPAAGLGTVGKIVHLHGVHLTALAAPNNANSTDPAAASTLQGRPYQTDLDPTAIKQTLLSSDSTDTTSRPFVMQGYTFYKTICFNPHGEARVNGTLPCTRIIEVGLQPTHGNVKNSTAVNVLAIQQAGIGGAVNLYRP